MNVLKLRKALKEAMTPEEEKDFLEALYNNLPTESKWYELAEALCEANE